MKPGLKLRIQLTINSPKFRRVNGGGKDYYYGAVSLVITVAGRYNLTGNGDVGICGFLHINSFDPENPSANLIGQHCGGSSRQFIISITLQATTQVSKRLVMTRATTSYILVTTTENAGDTGGIDLNVDSLDESNVNSEDKNNDAGKIAGIVAGSVVGGLLILLCCCTVCMLSLSTCLFCRKGTPIRSNKFYVNSGLGLLNEMSGFVFQSGSFSSYYFKDGTWHRSHSLLLAFYPEAGFIVHGSGRDNTGIFVITGVYSPRTLRIGLEKRYQRESGNSRTNHDHIIKIQAEWINDTQSFEGKYYLKAGKHREELKYILRPRNGYSSVYP